MSYNIEDHEDYLRKEMPFRVNEEQWQNLQQRVKENVMAAKDREMPQPKSRWEYPSMIAAAAGIALLIAVWIPKERPEPAGSISAAYENAELRLDQTINGLNDDELNWIQELNENELSEQAEYIENQVQL